MAAIYITEPGCVVGISNRQIVVTKNKIKQLQEPLIKIDRLVLIGNIQITAQAVGVLMEEGIDVSYLSRSGRLRAKLLPVESKNVFLRVAQYERYLDDEFQTRMATILVEGKIHNACALIRRYMHNYPDMNFESELQSIAKSLDKLQTFHSVDEIMGVEGISTAIYFRTFGKMFRGNLTFEKRTRRPPKDPVNAILSFGYTLLTNELFSLITAHGLDPYIGFLHGLSYGRPSLALDLVEEFRQPFIDRFTLSLFNNDVLTEEDFVPVENKGIYLTDDARKRFFEHYERRINESFTLPNTDTETTFRKQFRTQVVRMAQAIQQKKTYQPFRIYE
ncbi:CRISPR-associated endonuclease Cas1 [candidate division KSB1 bacterium]|nr:CRISPR-associated endonuclease Cas1 [candidate division KSB1 bacterium]